jgi:hypothetical protein
MLGNRNLFTVVIVVLYSLPLSKSVDVIQVDQPQECSHYSANEVLRLNASQRATLMSTPIIVKGLLVDWPLRGNLSEPEMVAMFSNMTREVEDGELFETSLSKSDQEQIERQHMLPLLEELFPTPEIVYRSSAKRRLSIGSNDMQVDWCQHGFAWLGLITGQKRWFFAGPDAERPSLLQYHVNCSLKYASTVSLQCSQRVGDIVIVPAAWWHSTCNIAPTSEHEHIIIGVGGEDQCDFVDGKYDSSKKIACHHTFTDKEYDRTHPVSREVLQVHTDPFGKWVGPSHWPLESTGRRIKFLRWLTGDMSSKKISN